MSYDLKQLREMSGKVAVVGVGETDYAADYQRFREARARGERPDIDSVRLGLTAFKRALSDSGLKKDDIEGLAISGQGLGFERVAEVLGLKLIWGNEAATPGDHAVQAATEAIYSGRCSTVAIFYGAAQRGMGRTYVGTQIQGYMNLWYYHPWGWSGQAAQYAMAWREYMEKYHCTEEQLATVAITCRKHAQLTENAIMRDPLTLERYMSSKYLVRPFRLWDICLVNDGGVCLILRRADMSRDLPHTPVLVAGVGRRCDYRGHTQIRFRFLEGRRENLKALADECFGMAGMQPKDIDHFQSYDGFSLSLPLNLEGLGFCKRGEAMEFIQGGRIGLGGELPCQTSGAMLSQSYMHGMNHQVEAVKQLRHEAGVRQVKDIQTSMYCHHGHFGGLGIIYGRGDAK